MTRKLLILTFLFYSCDKLDNHETMVGIWYSCDKDGAYNEAYIDKKHFTGFSTRQGGNSIWAYELKGDTIFYDLHDIGDSYKFNWGRIEVKSKDHIRINSYSEVDKKESDFLDFYRLTSEPQSINVLTLTDSLTRIEKKTKFSQRASKTDCKKVE